MDNTTVPEALVAEVNASAIASARRTVAVERDALATLEASFADTTMGASFSAAIERICALRGRVIVVGMGKSGLIGRKIAATLASTGTPSFFLHPGEASHGDLGMITVDDALLILSWSGETSELVDVLSYCARFTIPVIAITARQASTLGRQAQYCLTLPEVVEACPNNLAPTCSTTMQLALGDALAIAALEQRGFSPDDFRILHPRGQLAARMIRVADLMSIGDAIPQVVGTATIAAATLEMSAKRMGITAVVDAHGALIGAFSDGDLRRSLIDGGMNDPVHVHMTPKPQVVSGSMLASEALALMNAQQILQLFVDDAGLVGIVHMHDILRAGCA